MADTDLNINLKLNDEVSAGLEKSRGNLEKFSRDLKSMGRDVKEIGNAMIGLGAAMVGPLVLAYTQAAKNNIAVNEQMQRMGYIAREVNDTIASAMLPVMERLINLMENLSRWFDNLSPGMRDFIVQGTLIAGVLLIVFGTVGHLVGGLMVLGKAIIMVSSGMVQWAITNGFTITQLQAIGFGIVGVITVLGLMIVFWDKVRVVAIPVLNAIEVAVSMVAIGFQKVLNQMFNQLIRLSNTTRDVLMTLAQVPGAQQDLLLGLVDKINAAQPALRAGVTATSKTVEDLEANLAETLGGNGSMAAGVDGTVKKIRESFAGMFAAPEGGSAFQNMADDGDIARTALENMRSSIQGVKDDFLAGGMSAEEYFDTIALNTDEDLVRNQQLMEMADQTIAAHRAVADSRIMEAQRATNEEVALLNFYKQEYMTAHAGLAAFTLTVAQSIQTNMSAALTNMITGAMSAKEAFSALGKAMLQTVVEFMAKKLVAWAIEKAMLAMHLVESTAAATAIAAAWAPAAALVSLATFGSNAVPAAAGMSAVGTLSATIAASAAKGAAAGAVPMASGGDFMVNRPTLFLAGEAGPERATFTPVGKSGPGGGSVTVIVNYPQMSNTADVNKLAEDLGFAIERNMRGA